MINDCYINNLAKIEVCAVFSLSHCLRKCFTQLYRAFCGDGILMLEGTQTWRLLRSRNICHCGVLLFKPLKSYSSRALTH